MSGTIYIPLEFAANEISTVQSVSDVTRVVSGVSSSMSCTMSGLSTLSCRVCLFIRVPLCRRIVYK